MCVCVCVCVYICVCMCMLLMVLVVKAYQYTSITSVMLIDCSTIAFVMILSYCFLDGIKYSVRQYVSVGACVAGIGILVLSDYLEGSERIKGGAVRETPFAYRNTHNLLLFVCCW